MDDIIIVSLSPCRSLSARLPACLLAQCTPPQRWISPRIEAILQKMGQDPQGMLITVNHYSAPDFQAWWFAILISAIVPADIHWVVTSGWTNSGWLTGFTHWLFPRGARLLGFTPMPAMPPDPAETELRAVAVRKVLNYASHTPHAVIGMAPEGGDQPGGMLGQAAAGCGTVHAAVEPVLPQYHPGGGVEGGWLHPAKFWQSIQPGRSGRDFQLTNVIAWSGISLCVTLRCCCRKVYVGNTVESTKSKMWSRFIDPFYVPIEFKET